MIRSSVLLSLLLAGAALTSGCIMGVRKAIGTIQGPRSTIELLERNKPFPTDARVGSIALATDGEGAGDAERFALFKSVLSSTLRDAGLYAPDRGAVTLVVTLLTDTQLPARQKIVVEVAVSMPSGELGEARITTDLHGLANPSDVIADMAASVQLFLENLRTVD